MKRTKKGAASFYIVAITTLILMVLVVSFAAVIASEMERTTNDDLSQSAYDSALAGVEDAKMAYALYEKCITGESTDIRCVDIKDLIENDAKNTCDMVARILGKNVGDKTEVMIEEMSRNSGKGENNMEQYYTCDKLQTKLSDYRATLSSSTQMKVVRAAFAGGVKADMIGRVRVSWYSGAESTYTKVNNSNDLTGNFINDSVKFPLIGSQRAATPPTISVALVQTAENFIYSDFEATTNNGQTDRAMVYLVPTSSGRTSGVDGNHKAAWNGTQNVISADGMAATNNKQSENLPYTVRCGTGDAEFACSTTIELPDPIGGGRNDDTFLIIVSLPYGTPETDFSLEFLCKGGYEACLAASGGSEGGNEKPVKLNGVQVEIDSTGRANDIYRRVVTRMESSGDSSFLSIMGPLELYGNTNNGREKALEKNITVTTAN